MDTLPPELRHDRLCELNVAAQVRQLAHSPILQRAWDRGQMVSIHGWIYGLGNGRLRDLRCGRTFEGAEQSSGQDASKGSPT